MAEHECVVSVSGTLCQDIGGGKNQSSNRRTSARPPSTIATYVKLAHRKPRAHIQKIGVDIARVKAVATDVVQWRFNATSAIDWHDVARPEAKGRVHIAKRQCAYQGGGSSSGGQHKKRTQRIACSMEDFTLCMGFPSRTRAAATPRWVFSESPPSRRA